MAAGNQALTKAIADAVEKEGFFPVGDKEDVGVDKTEEGKPGEPGTEKPEKKADKQDEEVESKDPQEDQRTIDAKQLYAALENPVQARQVVEELARRVGLRLETTQQTPKAATKSILERMKDNVAPEYHFLVDQLAPALQNLVKEELETNLGPVRQTLAQQAEVQAKREVELSYEKMSAKHKDFKELEPKMNEIAKRIQLAPGASLDLYLEDLYLIASKDKIESKAVNRTVEKINKNAQEAIPASAEVSDAVKNGSRLPTLNEAINAAIRGERLG